MKQGWYEKMEALLDGKLSMCMMERYNNNHMKKVYPPEDLAKLVKDSVEYYQKNAERWREENIKSKDELRKEVAAEYENEITALKTQLAYSVTVLGSKAELDDYHDFCQKHMECQKRRSDWGRSPYVVQTHDGIGTASVVVCPICGEKKDITDINHW